MKTKIFLIGGLAFIASCNRQQNNAQQLQSQIDSLKQQIRQSYKPGLGEFMSSIQVHHIKLWFAGNAENWKLADFEVHELMEAVDDIKQYAADRPESKQVVMLMPAIDRINSAIQQKDLSKFKNSFVLLTNTCNNCHKAVNYDFNNIKIPDSPPFSNQVFKLK